MYHGHKKRRFGRTAEHRKAMFSNMCANLIHHEQIVTTLPKAKDLRPVVEKLVTLGKRGDLHARRMAMAEIRQAAVVKKLFDEIAPRFATRPGGYTRIIKLGQRVGDGASMVISEWPDKAAALAFWNSPEYAEAKQLRAGVADCQVLLIEAATINAPPQ